MAYRPHSPISSERLSIHLLSVSMQFRFTVQKRIDREDHRLDDFLPFSDGLVDLLVCMVANGRERSYISQHVQYCPESDPNIFGSPLGRAAFLALQILMIKLVSEEKRIAFSGTSNGFVTSIP